MLPLQTVTQDASVTPLLSPPHLLMLLLLSLLQVLLAGVKEWRLMLKDVEQGVLFLDEAYQLHPKKGAGQAGQQVLDLLMDHVENHVATST